MASDPSLIDSLTPWLPYLRTPGGGASLSLTAAGLQSSDGELFAVIDGLPRLLRGVAAHDSRWRWFYDLWAPFYLPVERFAATMLLQIDLAPEQARMVRALPIDPGARVLEVSPGPGVFQPWLAAAVGPKGALAAVDLSSGMATQCAARTRHQAPRPLIVVGDGMALPFADGAFDCVFHFGGIQLFADPPLALKEFARVVRPGGHVMVGDEGFSPDIAANDRRRRLFSTINPGFGASRPPVPPELELEDERWVYGGFAWLWTLKRR
jgi:ubiquinone/menaquinone biosynthesis C-methylase UbiE